MMVNLSIRKLDDESMSKKSRIHITHFEKYIECPFHTLPHLLVKNYMYSVFAFLGNHRLLENVCSEANLFVLDVDTTQVSMQDRFNELVDEGFSVILASTSNKTNLFKYRILMPLDRPVTPREYRRLMVGVVDTGLVPDIDMVSSTQILYSYRDSTVYSNFTGRPLVVDDYIADERTAVEYSMADTTETELPDSFSKDFEYFTIAQPGNRTKRLTHACYLMIELGFNSNQITKGVMLLNKQLLIPKSTQEIQRRVLNYILNKEY